MSDSHNSFRIPQHRVTVAVELETRKVTGTFACHDRGTDDPAADLLTLLASEERFVPFFPDGEKRPVLLSRRGIVAVELTNPDDKSRVTEDGDPRSISLVLMNDIEVNGQIRVSAPIGHTRTLDYLNEAKRFIHVYRDDGAQLLVNVRWILVAADTDEVVI